MLSTAKIVPASMANALLINDIVAWEDRTDFYHYNVPVCTLAV